PSTLLHTSGAPRHLHSFPTRRSSDLRNPGAQLDALRSLDDDAGREVPEGEGEHAPAVDVRRVAEESGAGIRSGRDRPHAAGSLRSEEHTSELQSRFDLVCRLLLENKK